MAELRDVWKHRNTLAEALDQALDAMAREIRVASVDELVDFAGSFYPGRAENPEWITSFERFVELLWQMAPSDTLAQLEAAFRARGPLWAPFANAFAADNGAKLHNHIWHPPGARRPAVVLR